MATQLLDTYRDASDLVVDMGINEVKRVLQGMDIYNADQITQILSELFPAVVDQYGNMQAALAADVYEELRYEAGVKKPYRAVAAPVSSVEATQASARWAVGPLWGEVDEAMFYNHVEASIERHILGAGRDTLFANVKKDATQTGTRARYARVARPNCCDFCQMLAGRGAVYHSEKSAGEMTKYHDKCRCFATVKFE